MNELGVNQPQGAVVQALGNMALVAERADNRVNQAKDAINQKLKEALAESEANNRLLLEKNAKLGERVSLLEQTNAQIETIRQVEKRASDARIAALEQKLETVMQKLNKLESEYSKHTHRYNFCCPHYGNDCSGNLWITGNPNNEIIPKNACTPPKTFPESFFKKLM